MSEPESTITWEDLGGEPAIAGWMASFYARIAEDPLLAGLFTQDLAVSRDKQTAFFVEFFGGPARYTEAHGKPFLRFKHRHVRIGEPERERWMALLRRSYEETIGDGDKWPEIEERVGRLATAMINHHPEKKDAYFFN